LRHEWDGPRYIYRSTDDPEQVRRKATRHFLRTFFNGSMESAVAAMLGSAEKPPTEEELANLAKLIELNRRKKPGARRR
jgi:predicted transcriptional regulator